MSEIPDGIQQAIDYSQGIPNNVDLSGDKTLQRQRVRSVDDEGR